MILYFVTFFIFFVILLSVYFRINFGYFSHSIFLKGEYTVD